MPEEQQQHPRRGRRWGLRLALALAAGFLALLAAELGWRIYHYGWGALSVSGMESIRPLGLSGILRPSDEWELYYELKPDLRTVFKLAPFETNSHGMRDDELALAKPPETFRVAFIGDSFVMGSGVPSAELFHSLLEQRWNAAPGALTYECLNFGVGGYGLRAYEAVLRHRALEFEPDLLVICLSSNDGQRPSYRPPNGSFAPKPVAHPFFKLNVLQPLREFGKRSGPERASTREARGRREARSREPRNTTTGSGEAGSRSAPGAQDFDRLGGGPFTPRERELYGRTYFAALRDVAERAGVPLVVVYLSMGFREYAGSTGNEYRGWAAEQGLAYFDTTPAFRGLAYEDLVIFPNDAHPNAAAQKLFAKGIDRFLRRRGQLGGLGPSGRARGARTE